MFICQAKPILQTFLRILILIRGGVLGLGDLLFWQIQIFRMIADLQKVVFVTGLIWPIGSKPFLRSSLIVGNGFIISFFEPKGRFLGEQRGNEIPSPSLKHNSDPLSSRID